MNRTSHHGVVCSAWWRATQALAALAAVLASGWVGTGPASAGAIDLDRNPTPSLFYARYKTSPVVLNAAWAEFPSLWLRSDKFERKLVSGSAVPYPNHSGNDFYFELFYGTWGDLFGDGSVVQVQGSWSFSSPANRPGSLHVIQIGDAGIARVDWTPIPGTSSPWIVDLLASGKPQIFVPGFYDFPTDPAQSYLVSFDRAKSSFHKQPIGRPTTSHTSFLGTWTDGRPAIMGTTYGGSEPWQSMPVLYRGDGAGGIVQESVGNRYLSESSIAFADFDGDGQPDVVTGDSNLQLPDGSWWHRHGTFLNFRRADGTLDPVRHLPADYFSAAKYDGVDSLFQPFDANQTVADVRTHNVAIRVADLNGDGRLDLLVSGGVWSNVTPYRILQILIQQPDGSFVDETDRRLFNFDLRASSAHQVHFQDVNGDGFPDLLISDQTAQVFADASEGEAANCATQGNEVLLNDGEGHFVSVMKDSFCKLTANPYAFITAFVPWFDARTRRLGYVQIDTDQQPDGSAKYLYAQVVARAPLSTGPFHTDPALRGAPGFNEWWYLRHHADAAAAVAAGAHASGLDFYLAVGKARGDRTHATYALDVVRAGTGAGKVTSPAAGIDCGPACSALVDPWTEVVLTAVPSPGSTFTGWGGACSGPGTCTVKMDRVRSVTANFDAVFNAQGLWWNPGESGWGVNFAHQGDIVFATWFTYDAEARPWWLIAQLERKGAGVYTGPVSTVVGSPWNATPFDPAKVVETVVGTATATFVDAGTGSFAYTVDGKSQTKAIVPQDFPKHPTCTWGAQADLALATNYTDLWWNPGESGWGLNLSHQGDTIFATWFTYDAKGKPWWLIAQLERTGNGAYAGPVSTVAGSAWDSSPFDSGKVVETVVGNARVTFAHGNGASFAYTVDGVSQAKAISRQVFVAPGTACR